MLLLWLFDADGATGRIYSTMRPIYNAVQLDPDYDIITRCDCTHTHIHTHICMRVLLLLVTYTYRREKAFSDSGGRRLSIIVEGEGCQ